MIGRKKYTEYLIQEAFEKCWAHSSLRAAARRITIHQVSLLSRRTPPAHRCPRRRQRQRQRVTEGTAMAPWNGPNKSMEETAPLKAVHNLLNRTSNGPPRLFHHAIMYIQCAEKKLIF